MLSISPPISGSFKSQETINSLRSPKLRTEEIRNLTNFTDSHVLPTSNKSPTNTVTLSSGRSLV